MLLAIGFISFLIGAALSIIGIVVWGVFDIDIGETMGKIGIAMMTIPFVIALLIGAFALLLSLFGLAILF